MANGYFQPNFYSREWATLNRRYLVNDDIQNNMADDYFQAKFYSMKSVTLNRRYLVVHNI